MNEELKPDVSQGKSSLFDYVLPTEEIMADRPDVQKYADFNALPLEERRVAFERFSERERLEVVLYGTEIALGEVAVSIDPFMNSHQTDADVRHGVVNMQVMAETIHVLQRVLQQERG